MEDKRYFAFDKNDYLVEISKDTLKKEVNKDAIQRENAS